MRQHRLVSVAAAGIAAAMLGACAGYPSQPASSYPTSTYPAAGSYPAPAPATASSALEFGRVTNIEYVPAGATTQNRPNVIGAVVGGVAGAVLGRQIGGGSGRDVATVLGGVGGAAVGSQVGRNNQPAPATAAGAAYRISVQTDQGVMRTYEVSATGDLRVGDRVRVENGVIYRA
ncbi:glycine zipper 2TM domain-containing protein [Ramlibacter tataouinensis]|nr:glycine zipper 2TM domain-containing protein [Ramlibacter tataouinensis]